MCPDFQMWFNIQIYMYMYMFLNAFNDACIIISHQFYSVLCLNLNDQLLY